jgi:type IV pilus assembly protein PilO
MANVREVRRKLTVALITLLCIDAACGIVLLSPIGRSARSGQQNMQQLYAELQQKTRETIPLQGIDQKVQDARGQMQQFYSDRLPQRWAYIAEELGKVAADNKVKIANARYKTEDTDIPGLRRVTIDATLGGGYEQEARFINALERDKMFFLIDSIALGEQQQQQQSGAIRLQIRLETYVRSEATA